MASVSIFTTKPYPPEHQAMIDAAHHVVRNPKGPISGADLYVFEEPSGQDLFTVAVPIMQMGNVNVIICGTNADVKTFEKLLKK